MRIFNVLGILFYAGILILIGIGMIVFAFNLLHPQDIFSFLEYLQSTMSTRAILGLSGLLLILISYSFAQLILGRMEREKTIAFKNPSGVVTISLSAIEGLIQQFVNFMPELKELRPDVIASKKGIIVNVKVSLRMEANLPELTARLQELIKTKVQEVLGTEEQIIIRIHISKIISQEERDRRKKESIKEEHTIPYGGFGRV
ncbi:MAG TPA: alkaline shock response membrane anchor protein AmaP [Candidatus Omnitrophota bacterium]|nr:alkaline shock response membrane anchor protein AmaP [Candidatus Omnitrophota bacterium]HRZ14858.1 alkaline shock response membrane anchor protein AmaP [Candidatus Omnitrophota bacterium]